MLVQVHHRGERGVDGILRLIQLAGHDGPLEQMLSAMGHELAAIAGVDIASVYVREGSSLVMRGNHGFPPTAIGTTLAIGEGITGLVAECMRPVSAAIGPAETAWRPVPGLGEERFPCFVGVPLIGHTGATVVGVLVLQRREGAFSTDEVTLATALGAPVTLAIERRIAAAQRSARLTGSAHVSGTVLGRAGAVPTTTALAGSPLELERALVRLRGDLGRALERLAAADAPSVGAALDRFALALSDARLRERLAEVAERPDALRSVAKEYARAAFRASEEDKAIRSQAVAELEELCVLLGEPAALRPGFVWIADRIHSVMAIAAVARGAAALVAADAISPGAIAIARAAGIPTLSDVSGLFGWVRPGDLLAVDGSSGTVLVHPAATDVEALRRAR
jgi:phosphotransferase system, enzyme I, PtsP